MEWIGNVLIFIMAGWSILDFVLEKQRKRKEQQKLKARLFCYTIRNPSENLVEKMIHDRSEMRMSK